MRNQRNHVTEAAVSFATALYASKEQATVRDRASRYEESGGADEQAADE